MSAFCCSPTGGQDEETPSSRALKAKYAISFYFALMGYVIGNFSALLPSLERAKDLSDAVLGAVLVPAVFGAMLSAPIVATIMIRYGSKAAVSSGGIVMLFLFVLVGIPGDNIAPLIVAVVMMGFSVGWTDTSVNGQAIMEEKLTRKSKLGLFHCLYAIGALCGSLLGGLLVQAKLPVLYEVVIFAAVALPPTVFFRRWLITFSEERDLERYENLTQRLTEGTQGVEGGIVGGGGGGGGGGEAGANGGDLAVEQPRRPNYRKIALLASIGLLAYMGEGSVGDWSTIYLVKELQCDDFTGVLGFAVFELMVALCRFCLDYWAVWMDRKTMLKVAGVTACAGLFLAGLAPALSSSQGVVVFLAILGFALCGAGIGVCAPIVIYFAGNTIEGMESANAIASVSSISYVGVLAGPPLFGGFATALNSLRYSFLLDGALVGMIFFLAFCLPNRVTDVIHPADGRSRRNDMEQVQVDIIPAPR